MNADERVRRALPRDVDVAALSVFTTQSFSHAVERLHDAIGRAPAPRLNFNVGPAGTRAVFDVSTIAALTHEAHMTAAGPLTPQLLANAVTNMRHVPGAVATVAFGTFQALDFTTRPGGYIPPIPTRTGRLSATGTVDVAFNLYLPSGTPPPRGWPTAICAPGAGGNKNTCVGSTATLTSHGIAVIAINAFGHGNGPRTAMTVRSADGTSTTVSAPGSAYDQNADGHIDAYEPRFAMRPNAVLAGSGPVLQTVGFCLQLVRAIQAGADVDGNGTNDLDAARIYYYGHSLGAVYGAMLFAYEPSIRAAVFVATPVRPLQPHAVAPLAPGQRTAVGDGACPRC